MGINFMLGYSLNCDVLLLYLVTGASWVCFLVPLTYLHHYKALLYFEHLLPFWHCQMIQECHVLPMPVLELALYLGTPCSFFWRMALEARSEY